MHTDKPNDTAMQTPKQGPTAYRQNRRQRGGFEQIAREGRKGGGGTLRCRGNSFVVSNLDRTEKDT
jgi:hypothetical protein